MSAGFRYLRERLAEAWVNFPDEIPHDPSDAQTVAGRLQRAHGIKDPEVLRAWLHPGKDPEDLPGDVPFLHRELSTAHGHLVVSAGSLHRSVLQRNVKGILGAVSEIMHPLGLISKMYWDRRYDVPIQRATAEVVSLLATALRNLPHAPFYPDAMDRGTAALMVSTADEIVRRVRVEAPENRANLIDRMGPAFWEELVGMLMRILRELTQGYALGDDFNDPLQDAIEQLSTIEQGLVRYAGEMEDD